MRSDNPTRCNPAPANTKEENSPQSSFCNLVMILPRTGKQWQEGNSFFSCICLRKLEEPIWAVIFSKCCIWGNTNTSLGSPRFGSAVSGERDRKCFAEPVRKWRRKRTWKTAVVLMMKFWPLLHRKMHRRTRKNRTEWSRWKVRMANLISYLECVSTFRGFIFGSL